MPKAEIVGNGYDLSINKYKETAHIEIEYDRPEVILNKIIVLEQRIHAGITELQAMIE